MCRAHSVSLLAVAGRRAMSVAGIYACSGMHSGTGIYFGFRPLLYRQ
ncbi:hypothetical protein ARUE_c40370 [Arthrobacter sp. Rue61a]|nr:hypothetical protein ARUE_c40370 [Arthrobacter sp. Rue61a]